MGFSWVISILREHVKWRLIYNADIVLLFFPSNKMHQNQNCLPKEHSKCQEWLRNKTCTSFGGDCGTKHLSNLEIWFGRVYWTDHSPINAASLGNMMAMPTANAVGFLVLHQKPCGLYGQFKFQFRLKAQKFHNESRKTQNLSPLPSNR